MRGVFRGASGGRAGGRPAGSSESQAPAAFAWPGRGGPRRRARRPALRCAGRDAPADFVPNIGGAAAGAARRRTSCQISVGLLRFGRNGGVRARYRRGCCGGGASRLRGRRWRVQATIPRSAQHQHRRPGGRGVSTPVPVLVVPISGTNAAPAPRKRRAGAAKAPRLQAAFVRLTARVRPRPRLRQLGGCLTS